MGNNESKPLGEYVCPNCGEEYESLEEVKEVWGKGKSNIVPEETVTLVICDGCGKMFGWEDNEKYS